MTDYFDVAALSKSFGSVQVLRDISFGVARGEFVTLLGASGSGKTTLLQIIAGFEAASAGGVRVDGVDLLGLPAHKREIGVVFQNYALFPHMGVRANVAYPLKLRGVDRAERECQADRALEMVRLTGHGDKSIDQLSGGQRQRVALARAIVFQPRILLMDEAMSALDKKLREAMQIELRRLHDDLGTTTIFVTHDQREAMTMSDRIAILNGGKLVQFAPPRDIYERPADRFVAEFIGETALLTIEAGQSHHTLFGQPFRVDGADPVAGRALVSVRPEKISLHAATASSNDQLNLIDATVTATIFQGESVLMITRLADNSEMTVRLSLRGAGAALPPPGAAVKLGIASCDAVVIHG